MGLTYSNARFRRKLSALNPRLRFFFGPGQSSGIYLIDRKSPDRGFRHVGSFPSPRYYASIPRQDFRDDVRPDREGNPSFVRGWNSIVRGLVRKGIFSRGDAKRIFSELK